MHRKNDPNQIALRRVREEVMLNYANVFTGLGRLEKPYHIEVDPTATPVVNPPRTIPAALRDRVKAELEDMEKVELFVEYKNPLTG